MMTFNFVFNKKMVPLASFSLLMATIGLTSFKFKSQTLNNNTRQTIFFNKGEEVELSNDKEGFKGAWYLATHNFRILKTTTISNNYIGFEREKENDCST